ncbi:MAG: class I SAM-dependent methyltransferase, partial [Anaerolineaceae bacterium]|nr:class I SAM-dependent methyltransferase [Anaerolineaceae bacterium]
RWEGNGLFAESIRTGNRPITKDYTTGDMGDHWVADYASSWLNPEKNLEQLDLMWESLEIQPKAGLKMLDVACGTGRKSLSLARRHPGVQVTLIDRPEMVRVAGDVAVAFDVEKQVKTIAGDILSIDFGSNLYDIILLGNITHFFNKTDNVRLFRKCYNALLPGGVVIINSVVRRDGEPSLLWIGSWLYATSPSGEDYNFLDYKELLESEGFINSKDVNSQLIKSFKS